MSSVFTYNGKILLTQNRKALTPKKYLFRDGQFASNLGTVQTRGQWDYNSSNVSIQISNEIRLAQKNSSVSGYSNYLSNLFLVGTATDIYFDIEIPKMTSGTTPTMGWFIILTRGIYPSNTAAGYSTVVGQDGISQWIDVPISDTSTVLTKPLGSGSYYLGFGVNKWTGSSGYTTNPLKIKSIWIG